MSYTSLNDYLKTEYGRKLYKLSLSSGCSCPNRDGKCGIGGCIFCSEGGSGDFASLALTPVSQQIEEAKARVAGKFKPHKNTSAAETESLPSYIAYFQSFTNTYGDPEKLRSIFMEAISHPDIAILSVGTRPDCLQAEILELLAELNQIKPVWVELGLQTMHEKTASFINRCYPLSVYEEAVKNLNALGIKVVTHLILGLPTGEVKAIPANEIGDDASGENRIQESGLIESQEEILESLRYVIKTGSWGIKLQLLHVLKNTRLADYYSQTHFHTYSLEEYCDLLLKCLAEIPKDMVVHRITGDGPKKLLIAPLWSGDKKRVLNTINAAIRKVDSPAKQ